MRRYPEEFKQNAVRLYFQESKSKGEIAKSLGICKGTFYIWLKKYRYMEENTSKENIDIDSILKENLELKKKLRNVEEEKEILKKAMAIFSEN